MITSAHICPHLMIYIIQNNETLLQLTIKFISLLLLLLLLLLLIKIYYFDKLSCIAFVEILQVSRTICSHQRRVLWVKSAHMGLRRNNYK